MPFWLETQKIVSVFATAMLTDGFLQFASRADFSRLWLVSSWLFAGAAVIALRSFARYALKRKGLFFVPTLLIGGGATAHETRTALRAEPSLGLNIVAQVKNLKLAFAQEGHSWRKMCYAYGASHVSVALDGLELQECAPLIAQLSRESVPFAISPPFAQLPVLGMVPHYFLNHNVLFLTRTCPLERILPRMLKRLLDIVVSGAILLLASPFLLVIGLLVKLDGGKALFGHKRIGRHNSTFSCLKFRSMVTNSQEVLERYLADHPEARAEWQETQKLQNDPRITRIGRFLRKSSLDELPQLFNVLKGDMSLVGPRPIVTAEIAKYDVDIAHYYKVRPGITGLWQASGRNDVSYAERVRMDSWYVRNWSLWHDIVIIFKTVPALLNRSGAY
jgi:Undecaprenyl-phosphate galactose phosphotransferase WbaP